MSCPDILHRYAGLWRAVSGFWGMVIKPDYVNNKAIVRPTAAEMDTDLYDDKK